MCITCEANLKGSFNQNQLHNYVDTRGPMGTSFL